MQVDGNTIIGDVLDHNSDTARIFQSMGLHCVGCPASRGESIREACAVHGIEEAALLAKLRTHLSAAQ